MGHSMVLVTMTEADEIIAEARELPLKDAAFLLWRECSKLDLLAWRAMPPQVRAMFRSKPKAELSAEMKYEHDRAEDGLTFDRLKLTHPGMDDAEIRHAIIAAVKFDDACFGYFDKGRGEFGKRFTRAVELAARDHPGYLELTYRRARYYISYYMK
jgi:hypothetical protein